jgi:hypothetical protein
MFKGLGATLNGTLLLLVVLGIALGGLLLTHFQQRQELVALRTEQHRLAEERAELEIGRRQLEEAWAEWEERLGQLQRQERLIQAEKQEAHAIRRWSLVAVGAAAAVTGFSIALAVEQMQRASRERAEKERLLQQRRGAVPGRLTTTDAASASWGGDGRGELAEVRR